MRWIDFNLQVACAPALLYSGVRKVVRDVGWSIPYQELLDLEMDYTDLGYSEKTKHSQLIRNYWNAEAIQAGVDKLLERPNAEHSSVGIPLSNKDKDSRSQGNCMQSMVITRTRDSCHVDLYYRSTEATRKFAADLVLFSRMLPTVFDQLGYEPGTVNFRFSNAYFSALFTPIICAFAEDQVSFFRTIQEEDPRFFRTLAQATRRYFQDTHSYTYRARVKMFSYWRENVIESEELKELLFSV